MAEQQQSSNSEATSPTSDDTNSFQNISSAGFQDVGPLINAIRKHQPEVVRTLLTQNRKLLSQRTSASGLRYPVDLEIACYQLLGAYLGNITPLHYALLCGHDDIASDIVDATVSVEDLDLTFGIGNTALHLATLLASHRVVKMLLERGADTRARNRKGISPLDVIDYGDAEMRTLYGIESGEGNKLGGGGGGSNSVYSGGGKFADTVSNPGAVLV